MKLEKFFKAIIDEDRASVVISTRWPTATLLMSSSFTDMRKVS